jgi:hypothetical protein
MTIWNVKSQITKVTPNHLNDKLRGQINFNWKFVCYDNGNTFKEFILYVLILSNLDQIWGRYNILNIL